MVHHPTRAAWCGLLAALVTGALAGTGAASAVSGGRAAADRQTHTFVLRDDQTWSVVADVATVRVVGDATRRDVRMDITREAATAADLARQPAVVRALANGPEVTLRQSDGALDSSLRADVVITTPATGSRGVVSIVEGGLDVRGFHGRLDADVRRGPIVAADVSGVLRLATTIGAVGVTGARLVPGGVLRLRTFNGDVRLVLAEFPHDARVMALALNGAIQSTVPLTIKDGWGPRWGETTLGSGAHVVSIDVVTGRIRIEAPQSR